MGQGRLSGSSRGNLAAKIQQIEVDQPGGIGDAADTAKTVLDGMQFGQ
jgi:hypothetical protein